MAESQPPSKKARTGVGSSVATFVPGEADNLILTLSKIKVERLLPRGRQVITSNTFETLPDVFKKMIDTNVLSLPVLNQKEKYYGVIEMMDLVEYVTTVFSDLTTTKFIDLEKMLSSEKKFTHGTVRDVMKSPISKISPFKPIDKGYSLFTAWEILAHGAVHRIPVIDEEEKICDIITQSMLIDFLWQNIEKIGSLADMQVKDLKLPPLEVLSSVHTTTKALFAFREMVRTNKSCLAVLDENGHLVNNISVRDLRGIHYDAKVFWRLWSSVADFKTLVRQEFPDKTPSELVYALPNDSLYSVVEKMAKQHIHGIYVVESKENRKPIRVITQTDILREILFK